MDISNILKDWPYEPGQVTARRIRGEDGKDKIQLRLDLGLYQMETTGRPDGLRPHEHESYLEYYEQLLLQHRQATGSEDGFELDERACELLRTEGMMFYHRYLAEFILEEFEAVERDTSRNIRLMDLCGRYAKEESDRYTLEQYRPYVIMMCIRAKALTAFRQNRTKAALAAIRQGAESIKEYLRRFGQEKSIAESGELAILRAMAKEIESRLPVDPIRKLRRDLTQAVREERYEDAAAIRDQLRRFDHQPQEQSKSEQQGQEQ